MSYLTALLVTEARSSGRAVRSSLYRHRHLTSRPLGLLFWQLGAEPFTAAAVAWGFGAQKRELVVAGEPRDRTLTFRALAIVANEFNRWFESPEKEHPQIVLPNYGNLRMLGRLGRRLAYLSDRDGRAPDPELIRFGRHLGFLANHARFPGQQLVVVATDLLSSHWVTGLSDLEQNSLPALDAAIEPPSGLTSHEAACEAERIEIGPMPGVDEDRDVDKLIRTFDERRGRGSDGRLRTDTKTIEPLLQPFHEHYSRLVDRGWPILWRAVERERALPEAPSVARRWEVDSAELDRHLTWILEKGGRYRTRHTHVQAAKLLDAWENADKQLTAEEAIDDPLRMIPSLLNNQAFIGRVVHLDMTHKEQPNKRMVLRPLVRIVTDDVCTMPTGKSLYWTKSPLTEWELISIRDHSRGGSEITMKLLTSSKAAAVPSVDQEVVFSAHSPRASGYRAPMLSVPPWPHVKRSDRSVEDSIEEGDGGSWE